MAAARTYYVFTGVIMSSQLLVAAAAASSSSSISLQISDSAPSDISQPVDLSFGGFGIEPSDLIAYVGSSQANQFTIQLLENLGNLTGKPPHIRIGGNTQDYMVYDSSQDNWGQITNPNSTGSGNIAWDNMLIGPRYFEAANRMPTGTPVTWGLNLAYNADDYISRITTMAQQVFDRCTNLNIVAFEIGNEPDLYGSNGFRSPTWSSTTYSDQWHERAAAIYEQVVKGADNKLPTTFFEAGSTSHTSGTTFEIETMASVGVDAKYNGSQFLATWNQHDYTYFVPVTNYDLTLETIMNFNTTEGQFADWRTQINQAKTTGFPYALREMGMVGPLGVANVTDTFGGALYTLNFLLYAAQLNVTGVQFHMTANSLTSAWAPVENAGMQPHVRPLYYGHAAFNSIIGPSCTAQVQQASLSNVPDSYSSFVRAYSVYQASSIRSLVLINSKTANASEANKASLTVSVSLPTSLSGKTFHLAYLTNDGLDSKFNTTWNGISYEQDNVGTPSTVGNSDDTATVASDGSLSFTVRDSQAVVANLGSKVGEGLEADKTACSALASRSPGTHMSTSGTSSASSGSSGSSASSADSKKSAGSTLLPSFGVLSACLLPLISIAMAVMLL